jgi:HEAT repeat protein
VSILPRAHRIPRARPVGLFRISLARLMIVIAIIAVLLSAWIFNRQYADVQRAWTSMQIRELSHADAARRRDAVDNLRWVAPGELDRAVSALASALADPDWQVRRQAAISLAAVIGSAGVYKGDLLQEVERATNALASAFEDRRVEVRVAAIRAAGTLFDHVTHRGRAPSRTITEAPLGQAARFAADALTRRLSDPSPEVRTAAAWSFARIGRLSGHDHSLLKPIAEGDPDSIVRSAAVRALSQGWPDDPTLYRLFLGRRKVATDQHEQAELGWAVGALRALPPPDLLQPLIDALKPDDWISQQAYPATLARLGAMGQPALPVLARIAHDELGDRSRPLAATAAIIAIDADSAEAQALIPRLGALVNDTTGDVRRAQAARLLGQFGAAGAAALAPLRAAVQAGAPADVQYWVADSLKKIERALEEARPSFE